MTTIYNKINLVRVVFSIQSSLSSCVRCGSSITSAMALKSLHLHNPLNRSVPAFTSATTFLQIIPTLQYVQVRSKFNKSKSKSSNNEEIDNDEEVDFADPNDGKDSKITKYKVTSLRTDLVIKQGLGLARNKVETAFYESKIRVNGKKIFKKSASIKPGDEIDVVRDVSPMNPEHIIVARLEILSVIPNTADITVVMRRFKSLTIENYESENAWRNHISPL